MGKLPFKQGQPAFTPLSTFQRYPEAEMVERSRAFYADIRRRKAVRAFTGQPVPREAIENALRAAGAAPSGANRQPWHFAVVSDPDQNGRYGKAHKAEAREFYTHRRRRNERTRWHPWAPTPTSLS
ncbi:nitroreductase family protein [Chromobacterium violaceum]|uniref:Probable oxidoreductase n=1 Tax=Chromobacterium violaceum (strain ATCC 12472 / DSM 30191 / JCM 1249 / CCUG 213 / NBRC 12614 / NCIMB 9131 / NCTC 9757 / MK) TaxID=243365 RepID=Q7NVJ8_CHRVO|nr:nitroreductase family protein [Chromobacterium violaceum]AAQ60016.1 probable oxidoreductase [Chromobacterium violaceum ATCC 12472]SUX35545.1 Putative NAD(P)H nitroreductase Spy0809 [Chromobacterium violaceum]